MDKYTLESVVGMVRMARQDLESGIELTLFQRDLLCGYMRAATLAYDEIQKRDVYSVAAASVNIEVSDE